MRTRRSPATRTSPSSDQAPFTAPGQINWFTNGIDTFIQLNTNADPTVDGIIQVLGVHTVDASWFSL